jgi:phosphatidylserine/phosphatidylglycerophosphate/cardiolipin synthase-like enzyme
MDNSFQLLVGVDAFIHEFTASLRDCRESLYVQFSTFEGDDSGQRVAHLMMESANAGVDVRLIVDCYSDVVINDTYPILLHRRGELQAERAATLALYDQMRDGGIEIQRTAPTGFLGMYMLYRNHKKMVIIDETTAFVGGICVSDHNFSWHDFVVKIQGDLVKDIVRDFSSTWAGQTQPFDLAAPAGDFVLNQRAGRLSIFQHILNLIETAQQSIVIESPYLLGDQLESKLRQAAERGIQVTLIMPFHSNQLMYRVWVRHLRKFLNHPNVRIFGIKRENNMTHAKLIVVDGKWAGFGSYNMFELESLTQKDLTVFSDNPDLLRQFHQLIEDDLRNSVLLDAPRWTWGRSSYRLVHSFFRWWTGCLVKNEKWFAVYA